MAERRVRPIQGRELQEAEVAVQFGPDPHGAVTVAYTSVMRGLVRYRYSPVKHRIVAVW